MPPIGRAEVLLARIVVRGTIAYELGEHVLLETQRLGHRLDDEVHRIEAREVEAAADPAARLEHVALADAAGAAVEVGLAVRQRLRQRVGRDVADARLDALLRRDHRDVGAHEAATHHAEATDLSALHPGPRGVQHRLLLERVAAAKQRDQRARGVADRENGEGRRLDSSASSSGRPRPFSMMSRATSGAG